MEFVTGNPNGRPISTALGDKPCDLGAVEDVSTVLMLAMEMNLVRAALPDDGEQSKSADTIRHTLKIEKVRGIAHLSHVQPELAMITSLPEDSS
jgi:hypothetical protein